MLFILYGKIKLSNSSIPCYKYFMKLDKSIHIKEIPPFLSKIPILSHYQGVTILQTIYLHPKIYQDIQSGNNNPKSVGVILHEQTHIQRARKIGILKFGFLYLFSARFRFYEELEANKVQWHYLKQYGIALDIKKRARMLSSWIYLWSMSYENALKELENTWREC